MILFKEKRHKLKGHDEPDLTCPKFERLYYSSKNLINTWVGVSSCLIMIDMGAIHLQLKTYRNLQ